MERSTKRISFIVTAALGLIISLSCSSPTTGLKTVLVEPDSVRYIQAEKDQPYGLLWPNREFNLWRRVSTHSSTFGFPPRSESLKGSFVYRGSMEEGSISGTVVDAAVDSGNFVGGDFYLQERWDTLEGRCSVRFMTPVGVYEDTLHLIMVRQ